jgi:hypothetical protein
VRAVSTALTLHYNVLETIEEIHERAILLRELLSPDLEGLQAMSVGLCNGRRTENAHIGLLGESLVENIEQTKVELMGIMTHTHLQLLEDRVLDTGTELGPEVGWTDDLPLFTFL